ncbi:hypothetical protein KBA01_25570 [Kozakia baliensis]|nr:hypothetical protein KBA01_25570 [Kozakia baliensis]
MQVRRGAQALRRQPSIEDHHAGQSILILTEIRHDFGESVLNARMAARGRIKSIDESGCLVGVRKDIEATTAENRPRWRKSLTKGIPPRWRIVRSVE